MSLLQAIRGEMPLEGHAVDAAVARLCAELLRENRLRDEDVVAARFTAPGAVGAAAVLAAARSAGWVGIPLFVARGEAGLLAVDAHVRLKKKRRLRTVLVQPPSET